MIRVPIDSIDTNIVYPFYCNQFWKLRAHISIPFQKNNVQALYSSFDLVSMCINRTTTKSEALTNEIQNISFRWFRFSSYFFSYIFFYINFQCEDWISSFAQLQFYFRSKKSCRSFACFLSFSARFHNFVFFFLSSGFALLVFGARALEHQR